MSKPKHQFKTQTVTLSFIEPTCRYLSRLVATGLYGNNEADVAKNIVLEKIRQMVGETQLVELPPMAPTDEKAD